MTTTTLDEINAATGYANGELFANAAEVTAYFTPAAQTAMFGADAETDAGTLAGMAAEVIGRHDHMAPAADGLISAAHQAAHAVEAAAAELNTVFTAEQGWYGVEFEALVGGDWVRGGDLDPQQEADAEAVRLFDCDGERGNACRTVAALATEKAQWIYGLALSATEPSDDDAE